MICPSPLQPLFFPIYTNELFSHLLYICVYYIVNCSLYCMYSSVLSLDWASPPHVAPNHCTNYYTILNILVDLYRSYINKKPQS